MVGTGITPEGINQNYIVYDFMLEHGYTVQPTNIMLWINNYVQRRLEKNSLFVSKDCVLYTIEMYNL